jgi:disulfide bond formation protein DsbB
VVDCSTAAWRFLGVSLAGWNALIGAALGSIAGSAALRR